MFYLTQCIQNLIIFDASLTLGHRGHTPHPPGLASKPLCPTRATPFRLGAPKHSAACVPPRCGARLRGSCGPAARRPPPGAPATPRTHHTGLAPATAQHRPPSSEPALRPPWGAAQDPRARLCPPRGTAQGGAAPGAPCATRACRRVPGTAERMGWAGGTTWVGLHADVGPGHVVADGALALQWHALRGGSRVAVAGPGAVATARHAHGRGGQRALRRLLHGHVARTCRGEGPGVFNPCKADGLTAPPRAPSGRGLRPLVRAPGATAGPHPRPGARRSCQKVLWSPKP